MSVEQRVAQYNKLTSDITKLEGAIVKVKQMKSDVAKAMLDENGKTQIYDLGDGVPMFVSSTKAKTFFLAPRKRASGGRKKKAIKDGKIIEIEAHLTGKGSVAVPEAKPEPEPKMVRLVEDPPLEDVIEAASKSAEPTEAPEMGHQDAAAVAPAEPDYQAINNAILDDLEKDKPEAVGAVPGDTEEEALAEQAASSEGPQDDLEQALADIPEADASSPASEPEPAPEATEAEEEATEAEEEPDPEPPASEPVDALEQALAEIEDEKA
jgi:hypothetical protein